MAGLKESLEDLKAAWEAIPADKRAAAGDEGLAAALMAGNALRIVREHVPALSGPVTAAGVKLVTAGMIWRVPLHELFGLIELVFPELVKALKAVAAELGFEDPTPPAPPVAPGSP